MMTAAPIWCSFLQAVHKLHALTSLLECSGVPPAACFPDLSGGNAPLSAGSRLCALQAAHAYFCQPGPGLS